MLWFWVFVLDNLQDVPDSILHICSPIKVLLDAAETYPEQVAENSQVGRDSTNPINLSAQMTQAAGWLRAIAVDRLTTGVSVLIPSPVFSSQTAAQAWLNANGPALAAMQSYKNSVLYQFEPK